MEMSGGTELHAIRLVEGLRSRGHEVFCATLTDEPQGLTQRYEAAGVSVLRFPVTSLINSGALQQVARAREIFRNLNIDVVHSHDMYSNFLMTSAARAGGISAIASRRWIHYDRKVHRATDRLAYTIANRVMANADAVAETLIKSERISARKVVTIKNPIDEQIFDWKFDRNESRRMYGIPADAFVIGTVARLRAEKNHATLMRAAAELSEKLPNLFLLFVGDGPERLPLERLAGQLGITARVLMPGHQESAWKSLAAMDLFVLPSLYEGFPNAVLEAMAAGVPVAATAVGGVPEVIRDGYTGTLLGQQSAEAFVRDLRTALSDLPRLRRMAEAGRTFVAKSHRLDAVLDQHEQLYAQVCTRVIV